MTGAIGPGAEFLDQPGCKSNWRVSQRKGKGLGLGSLDELVSRFFSSEVFKLSNEVLYLRTRVGVEGGVSSNSGQEVEMNAAEMVWVM